MRPFETPPDPVTDPEALTHMLDAVQAAASEGQREVGALIDAAGPLGAVPIMTLIALIVVSPLSAIPLLSSVCGSLIAVCALQAAFGRRGLWLPGIFRRRQINPRRVIPALQSAHRVAHWLEARAAQRLRLLTMAPVSTLFLLLAASFGASMPFLELVPMSSSLLAFSVTLIGLGLMLRDGLLMLASLITPGIAATIVYSVWFA